MLFVISPWKLEIKVFLGCFCPVPGRHFVCCSLPKAAAPPGKGCPEATVEDRTGSGGAVLSRAKARGRMASHLGLRTC